MRQVRHESWGERRCRLQVEARKWQCRSCGSQFRQRFPGILAYKRASEPFRHSVFVRHWDSISRSRFCGLKSHGVYDVVLGRSEAALESYLAALAGQRTGALGVYGSVERLSRARA